MQAPNRSSAMILGVAMVLGLASLGLLLGNAALAVKELERTVTVKGLSEMEVPANLAAWPLTFQVAGNDLDDVYQMIERKTDTVEEFLAGFGIEAAEISIQAPNISDLHAQQWGNNAPVKFRFTGTASLTVYSENIAAVRKAMSSVLELGKRGVAIVADHYGNAGSNQFMFTGLNELKPLMIEEATKNARAVAEKFAADSNSRLGKIKSARQGQFSIQNRDSTTPHIKKVRVVSTVEYYLSD